jgi:hypothetical protein
MKRSLIIPIALLSILMACNAEKKEYANVTEINGTTDSVALTDTLPKIIKTADARFQVKDVQKTKEDLSAVIKQQGGTIAEFVITSNVQESKKVKYSIDSLKQVTSYQKDGFLVAKIPSDKLDDFTNTIAKMAVFVDQQSLKMDDQSITYLANKLKAENRIEAVKEIKKVSAKKSVSVESSMYIKDDYVDRKVENLSIADHVKYSTITLSFYESNKIRTLIVANDNLDAYQSGFFKRLWLNVLDGWMIFTELILFLSKLWALFLAGFIGYFGYKYYVRKRKLGV